MQACIKCKGDIRGESGIQCAGICGKVYHFTLRCCGLDKYSSGLLDTNPMLKFICEDCIQYVHNVDLALKDIQLTVTKNGNYLKEYKDEFEDSLKRNEMEIKDMLVAIEKRYAKRLEEMKKAQQTCEQSVLEIKKITAYTESFKEQSEKIVENVKKLTIDNKISVSEMKNDLQAGVKQIAEFKQKETAPSYAETIKQAIYIKPKNKQMNSKTKQEIKENINPASLSLKVDSVSDRKEGAITINCRGEETVQKIEKEMKTKLGEKYEVKVFGKKCPQLIIADMNEKWNREELEIAVKKQNNIQGTVKCVKDFKNKNKEIYYAVIEINESDYQNLLEKKKINIGWEKCRVFEYFNVTKCFKCSGYHHIAKYCKNETKCGKCSKNHETRDCQCDEVKCINCIRYNEKFTLNLDTNHDSRNTECSVYKRLIQAQKNKFTI